MKYYLFVFGSVFCHPSAGDEKKDLVLQRRLHSLNWITWEQLEIPIDFDSESIDKLMRKAQAGTLIFELYVFRHSMFLLWTSLKGNIFRISFLTAL